MTTATAEKSVARRQITHPATRRSRLPEAEARLSFKEVGAAMDPKRPEVTVYKWATRGYRGVTLEYERQAGRLFTSMEAVERFLDKVEK